MSANLVLNVLPRFPAHVRATDGLVVEIENAVDLVIKPDYGSLVPVPAVTNPAMTYFKAWDKSIDYYQSISFQDFADNLADQVLVGTLLALKNVTFAADQGVYFSGPNTAVAYSLSSFVRGISGSADAAAFRTAIALGNVNNTSDVNKPVSTAQQTALDLKADKTITISGGGLATGGGNLSANGTITVTKASSAQAIAGTDDATALTPSKLRDAMNSTGSAPIFATRAWANFNGTGTVAIRASGNVSSITDNGTGDYTVNFTTAMPDANYVCQITAYNSGSAAIFLASTTTFNQTTSSFRFGIRNQSATLADAEYIFITVVR
jgi:hypothetical protein